MDNVLKGPHMVNIEGTILDDEETKGLALVALPDWRNTPEEHVHIFENAVEGSDASYTISPNNNRIAYFSATFGDEESVPIIAPITKAGGAYAYTAVIAPRDENGFYVIPDVQKPDTKISLIDPEADFLIGCEQSLSAPISASDKLSMDFKRPVTLFRLAIVNIDKSEAIKSISLTTDTPITGKFTYSDVNFSSGTVDFDTTEGSKTVTLEYENLNPSTITYAYFVIIPGKTTLKSVAVKTATYTYTKPLDASQTFNLTTFKSLALDMSVGVQKTKNSGTGEPGSGSDVEDGDLEDTKTPQTLSFGDVTEFTHILGEEDFTEPTLTGAETTVTYSVECTPEGVATIDTETGKLSFGDTAGQVVVTASAESDDTYKAGSAFYTVTVLPAPVDQPLKWMLNSQEVITTLNAKVGVAFTSPTLEGAVGNVDFTSNNGSVATVSTSGIVSIVGVGNVTITATAAAASGYKETSKSYDIVVAPADPAGIVLSRVESVEDGGMYVIVNNGKALQNNSGVFGAVDVEVAGDHSTVTFADNVNLDNLVWTWTSSSLNPDYGEYTVTNGTDYLYVSGDYYSGYDANIGNYGSTDVKYVVWRYTSSQVQNGKSTAQRYLTYDNGWAVPSKASSHDTYLFEYVDPRTSQELSFSSNEAEYDLGTSAYTKSLPTLSGVQTSVTWSSSNPEIASVDNNGTVTPLMVGQVTITAKAAGSKTFKPAEAKYTLSVINSTIKVSTYVKVTSQLSDWTGTYLFVKESANAAFAYNQNNFKTSVVISNGQIVSDDYKAYELTVSASTMGAGKYDITTAGSPKMYVYSYGDTFLYESNIKSGNQYCATFTFGNGGVSVMCQRSGGTKNYMRYENGAFNFVRDPSTTPEPIQLYKLDDGSSPTPPTPPTPTTDVTYTKISSLDELNETDTYIIVNTDATKAFAGILNQDGTKFKEKDASNAVAVTSKSNVITSNDLAACEFQIKKHSELGKFYLKFVQADKYLWLRYNNQNFTAHDNAENSETISESNGQFEIKRDSYYFRYSSSNGYFYGYNLSSKVLIYKKSAAN